MDEIGSNMLFDVMTRSFKSKVYITCHHYFSTAAAHGDLSEGSTPRRMLPPTHAGGDETRVGSIQSDIGNIAQQSYDDSDSRKQKQQRDYRAIQCEMHGLYELWAKVERASLV